MQTILEQNRIGIATTNETDIAFGGKIGLLAALFGCRHKNLTRPMIIGNASYRACVHCGLRKQFDTKTLKT